MEQENGLDLRKHLRRVAAAPVADRHSEEPVIPTTAPRALLATLSDVSDAADVPDERPEATSAIGVGPWVGAWPDDPRLDADLLGQGDRRNVADRYRYWSVAAIVADLDQRRHSFHVAIENWQHDFNIGSVVRTANAFLAAEVHVVGRRRWNRRGAMVTDRYQHVRHHKSVASLATWAAAEGLPLIGVENSAGAEPIEEAAIPKRCVLVLGQEGPGLTPAMESACARTLVIAQYGSTRSINAGAAAAIAMHAWIRQHAAPPP
jgi:tRNA(Leu) C34 or U34 (ribose-2'-O)-methylase TrmL